LQAVGIVKEIYQRLESDALPDAVPPAAGAAGADLEASGVGSQGGTVHYRRQQYLVLDFSRVPGIDATAARSCFIRLKQLVDERGVIMILTHMRPRISRLLKNHGVIPVRITAMSASAYSWF